MHHAPTYRNPSEPTKRIAIAIDLNQVVPWHYDCCQGILEYGRTRGWSCEIDPLFMDHGNVGEVGGYDGVVGRIDAEVAKAAQALGIPVVNHWMNSPAKDLPGVAIDSRAGALMVGEHLVMCGYRSLGYLDLEDIVDAPLIEQALTKTAADAGLHPPAVCLCDQALRLGNSRQSYRRFLDEMEHWLTGLKTPVGLFIGDSTWARYVAQRCKRLGLSVPTDVGIVVWNDDESTTTISPTLSALEHDWIAVGYQSAAMLDELMQGKSVDQQQRLVPPTRLIVRDSTDVFLCDDELVTEAMGYIAKHCRQELKVQDVADALSTSRRTLYRKFEEVLGRSIKDEIKRLRTERLKILIEDTDQPLSEIAHAFGFSTAAQFSRYFSQGVGMAPSEYRKKFGALDATTTLVQ